MRRGICTSKWGVEKIGIDCSTTCPAASILNRQFMPLVHGAGAETKFMPPI